VSLSDAEAEKALLAAMLADPRCIDAHLCPPDAWSTPAHEAIADAMRDVLTARLRVSEASIIAHLRRVGRLDVSGGEVGVYELATGGALLVNVPTLHERVMALATLRRRREHARLAMSALEREDGEAATVHLAAALEAHSADRVDRFTQLEAIESATIRVMTPTATEGLIPTGIEALDCAITGIGPGELMIVGAATNVGKSSLLLDIALRQAALGYRPGYISVEDPRRVIEDRILAREARVPGSMIRSKEAATDPDMIGRMGRAIDARRAMPERSGIVVSYIPGATDADVTREVARMVRSEGCDVVMLDYVGAVECSTRTDNARGAVTTVGQRFKSAIGRLGVPGIAASQITMEKNANREPTKYDLRDSQDLANMSDLVIVLWRTEERDDAIVSAKVAKGKNGSNGLRMAFSRSYGGMMVDCEVPESPHQGGWKR